MTSDVNRQREKRLLSGLYILVIQVLRFVLDCLPGPFGSLIWRPFLAYCGHRVVINHHVYFKYPKLVDLGDDASTNRGAEFYPGMMRKARIHIGTRVRIASYSRLHAAGHDPDDAHLADTAASIVIVDDIGIGACAIVLPGVCIGHGAVVAAGAVVSRDVATDDIVADVPARPVRNRDMDS